MTMELAEAKAQYSAILLGATGNVGGRIVQLLIKNPLCMKMVMTRRKPDALGRPQGLSQCDAIVRSRSYWSPRAMERIAQVLLPCRLSILTSGGKACPQVVRTIAPLFARASLGLLLWNYLKRKRLGARWCL
jgi:hypothetical protein